VLKEFAQALLDPADWEFITWRVTVGGVPVDPWTGFSCQIGSMMTPRKMQIILPPESVVALEARSTAAHGDVLKGVGMLSGWFWPMPSDGDIDNAHGNATVA